MVLLPNGANLVTFQGLSEKGQDLEARAMDYDFTVNQRFSVQTQHVGRERQPVLILEDFVRDADALVRYATNESRFAPSPLSYPGVVAPAPAGYVDSLVGALLPVIGATFGVKVETAFLSDCFFAIATFGPEQLHFGQRLPHVDDFDPGLIAVLHYLCDGTKGGTALYRHRATGYESLTEEQNREVQRVNAPEIAKNPLPPVYPSASTPLYEQTARFDAKFNRLIAYRSRILHSMAVDPNTVLHPEPRTGRLTVNTFLRFELA